jgi:CheY-like chemotaxis protein
MFPSHQGAAAVATSAPELDAAGSTGPALASRGERIAIVDDEAEMIAVTKAVLRQFGYEVVTYASAARFLKVFESEPDSIDLVITDLVMPGMTGAQLTRALRDNGHEVPVLLMTGFGIQPRTQWGVGAGRVSFVRKPFSAVQLAQAIRRLLAG